MPLPSACFILAISFTLSVADIRYMSGSTIITSQLMFKSLPEAIDPSPIRDALADRLFRHNDIYIELKGKSWRGSDKEIKGNK